MHTTSSAEFNKFKKKFLSQEQDDHLKADSSDNEKSENYNYPLFVGNVAENKDKKQEEVKKTRPIPSTMKGKSIRKSEFNQKLENQNMKKKNASQLALLSGNHDIIEAK